MNVGKYLTGAHREQQRHRSQSADPHRRSTRRGRGTTATRLGIHARKLRPAVRPACNPAPTANAAPWTTRTSARRSSRSRSTPISFTAGASARTTGRWASRCSRKLVPRVGVTVGYFRRSFGNFYTADNRLTTTADYTPFSVPIPVDPRLPGGGGGTVHGVVQPRAGQGRSGGSVLAALLELRRDDRELARRRRQRQRAAAQRSDRAGRHELGPTAPGQLRREIGVARDLQLAEHTGRADDAGHRRQRVRWPTRGAGSSNLS